MNPTTHNDKALAAVHDIMDLITRNDIQDEDVGDLVRRTAETHAKQCNAGGIHRQIPFLIATLGPDAAVEEIRKLIKPRINFSEEDLPSVEAMV